MLVKGELANNLKAFIKEANRLKQEDQDKAIDQYCKAAEAAIYNAIKKLTITIPTGGIQVQGSPSAQANIAPIVLNGVIK